jgi:hypothetical protein
VFWCLKCNGIYFTNQPRDYGLNWHADHDHEYSKAVLFNGPRAEFGLALQRIVGITMRSDDDDDAPSEQQPEIPCNSYNLCEPETPYRGCTVPTELSDWILLESGVWTTYAGD